MIKVTAAQKLAAFACYTLAAQHYAKAAEFERGLGEALGMPPDEQTNNDFGDGIYGRDGPEDFDRIFQRAGFVVEIENGPNTPHQSAPAGGGSDG